MDPRSGQESRLGPDTEELVQGPNPQLDSSQIIQIRAISYLNKSFNLYILLTNIVQGYMRLEVKIYFIWTMTF